VAIVSKAKTYAAYFRAAPGGGLRDRHLHLSLFRGETRRSLLLGFLAMLGGRHGNLRAVETVTCDWLRLAPVGDPVPYERDGDSEGHLPLEVRVVPDALDLAAP
jgi:diacylglycerol kinase family enzyme